jgi:hypothetical protein
MDDLIRQSTAVVRVKVTGSYSALRGADIYTFYQVSLIENLKPGGTEPAEVAVPGGVYHGTRQVISGAPALTVGQEYVMFLWTSRSGLNVILGLTQGLYQVTLDGSGQPSLSRPAAAGVMVDRSGQVITDRPVTIGLSDLRARIQKATAVK